MTEDEQKQIRRMTELVEEMAKKAKRMNDNFYLTVLQVFLTGMLAGIILQRHFC